MSQAIHNGKKGEPLCGRAPSWARIAKRGEMITCKWRIKKAKKVSKSSRLPVAPDTEDVSWFDTGDWIRM